MKPQKKIWELQHTTVCKVVGMALDLEEMKKIGRKFGLVFKDTGVDEEFAFHSAIVGMCGKESNVARHVQKLIERRFLRYSKRFAEQPSSEITELVLNGSENSGIPLWAILWHLATSHVSDGERLEAALFWRIHMLEHRLLKDFWKEKEGDREKIETDYREEINSLRREIIKLRSANADLEKTNRRMTSQLSPTKGNFAVSLSTPTSEVQGSVNDQARKIEKLRHILEESRKKTQELAEEYSQSKKQIKVLTQELLSQEISNSTENEASVDNACPCQLTHCLRGKRIAMVGGIDSLESHYKNLVERSGGQFCRHDGRCCRGERKLEDCIRNADLVVCPVSVNSHFGASGVKKVCRRHGISCFFPDSAGLGALRNILMQHFASDEETLREPIKDLASNE